MHFAILAAGEGSRLREEGILQPKPLIPLGDLLLVERLINLAKINGFSSISVVTNEIYTELKEWFMELELDIPFNLVLKTTPSSMHSLFALRNHLRDTPFCLTTVDSIFDEKEFAQYITFVRNNPQLDGTMAVTRFVEDEKPLWINTSSDLTITGFHSQFENQEFVSGGIYCLQPSIFPVLDAAIANGMQRMRNFQQELVEKGFILKAFEFSKIIDIDHALDLIEARNFLRQRGNLY
jgi:NDP-sugar pyrophosphorylase family protein